MLRIIMQFKLILMVFFIILGFSGYSHANENDELAIILKQLQQVKQSLVRSQIISTTGEKERYSFDYQAAKDDINIIIDGIESYLSPDRAQPRKLDLPIINGNYSEENKNNE